MPEEAGLRRLHLVYMPGPFRMGDIHGQHDVVTTPIQRDMLQGNHIHHTSHPKVDWC